MDYKVFNFNLFDVSTVVLYDAASREAAIVDPGMTDEHETAVLTQFIAEHRLTVKYLICTHLHIDHIVGVEAVERIYGVGLSASPLDDALAQNIAWQRDMFRLKWAVPDKLTIDAPLRDGDRLMLGDEEIDILAVPGHSPGGIALYMPQSHLLVAGDALFAGSIGRTDLPGGDYATLIRAIQSRLMTLPDDTVVIPGHGPATTIGAERRMNPYI